MLLTCPHCRIKIEEKKRKRKKAVAVWSSFRKNEWFFHCVMMFLKLLFAKPPLSLSLSLSHINANVV